jgi:hypothetical protein
VSGDVTSHDRVSNDVAFGLTYGRKWATRSGFLYESYVGAGRYIIQGDSYDPEIPSDQGDFSDDFPAWDIRIGLIIGWRLN